MANEEHLKILKQGVEAWNKWRKENPDIKPDLSKANLAFDNLSGANFAFVNFNDANLTSTVLRDVNLREAKLRETHLSGAVLQDANLREAWLLKTNIWKGDLSNADLRMADLRKSNLIEANLHSADLRDARLSEANLSRALLSEANLSRADLFATDFCQANMQKANLKDVHLCYCYLVQADLTGSTLTGAKLYGTARDDWVITDVKCEYVYWDRYGEQRSPRDRDLEPGEFERLYAALPSIEYIFEEGMSPLDPLIMDRVVEAIREKQPEFDIKIDSINARGLAPSIKFSVLHEEHKEPALEEVRKGYEAKIILLEAERDRYWEAIRRALDKPRKVKLITAGPGAIVATDGSTINIQQHVHNALELQKAIADEPEESESFAKVAKKTALDIIGGAIKDIAKGQVKEAAKQIIELGKDLGPVIAKTAAYAFFRSM